MVHVFLAYGWNKLLISVQVIAALISVGLLVPAVRGGSLTAVASVSVVVYVAEASALIVLLRTRLARVEMDSEA
jgi:hypothetical protein